MVNIAIYGGVQNIPLFARKTCDEVIQGWAAAIYEFGFLHGCCSCNVCTRLAYQKSVNMQLFRKYYAPGGKIPAKLQFFSLARLEPKGSDVKKMYICRNIVILADLGW